MINPYGKKCIKIYQNIYLPFDSRTQLLRSYFGASHFSLTLQYLASVGGLYLCVLVYAHGSVCVCVFIPITAASYW